MGARKRDIIDVVEVAYRVTDRDRLWLEQLVETCRSAFANGLGAIACFYNRAIADPKAIMTELVNHSVDERLVTGMRAAFEQGSPAERDRSMRDGGPIIRLTSLCNTRLKDHPLYGAIAREVGFDDVVTIRAGNPDGTGVILSAPTPRVQPSPTAWDARWSRIAAHIAAGSRLQRAATNLTPDAADAVLAPDGRVLSAEQRAQSGREALRRAAVAVDKARGGLRRRDATAALDAWTALVDGRWSLVDHFETDGKRFVLAVPNVPSAPDPRALTEDERPILHYVAMGHSNKLIAYELGLPEGTIATRLKAIMRKLGVRSRVEVVDRYVTLRDASVDVTELDQTAVVVARSTAAPLRTGRAALTAAERDVGAMAARGLSNEQIARKRRCSPRTVANLLASAYRKLGITSRAELALSATALMTTARN